MTEQESRYRYCHNGPLARSKATATLIWIIIALPILVIRIAGLLGAAMDWAGNRLAWRAEFADRAVIAWAHWMLSRGEPTARDRDEEREQRRLEMLADLQRPAEWRSLTHGNAP